MIVEDILVFPPRDSKGVVHVGDFVMKTGKFPVQIYMTKSKISAPYTSEGDEDSASIKQMFEGQHPGNKKEIREFIQNWMGKNVIIIHGSCSETEKEVVGTPCAPLQLKPEKQDNNDGRHHTLKFEAFAKSAFLPGLYEGAIALEAPVAVTDATDLTILNGLGTQWKLPVSATADEIKLIWGSLGNKETFTLIGSGGVAPDTLVNGSGGTGLYSKILLKDGTTWVALDGATITLQAYSCTPNYFIEVARS